MKILSDSQLYPSSKPFLPPQSSQLFPAFPMITPSFLSPTIGGAENVVVQENEDTEEITEAARDDLADAAEASEMTNTKSNNDTNGPSHREAMNQILKKLALKSQENLKKSKEESCRYSHIFYDNCCD